MVFVEHESFDNSKNFFSSLTDTHLVLFPPRSSSGSIKGKKGGGLVTNNQNSTLSVYLLSRVRLTRGPPRKSLRLRRLYQRSQISTVTPVLRPSRTRERHLRRHVAAQSERDGVGEMTRGEGYSSETISTGGIHT